MKRRALVVGSQVFGLTGVHNDVEAMEALLSHYGFDVDRRTEADASRDGILDGYRKLILDSRSNDAVVVYYSGHGGFAVNPTGRPNLPKYLQCIVPTDWATGGAFRGILSAELSAMLAELTARTKNVAVILDCCHAAQMSRAADPGAFVPRALPRAWADGVADFLAHHPIDLTRVHVESNPDAVRLVATEADRSAYEALQPANGGFIRMGLLTRALQIALEEFGPMPVSWRTLALRVRELVMNQHPEQRPEVEGPADRLLFATTVAPRSDAVVFFVDNGRPSLRASRLLGARVGAVYDVLPPGAMDLGSGAVAEATVTELVNNVSRVELRVLPGQPPPQAGALAIPRALPYPRARVAVRGDAEGVARLRDLLWSSRFLDLAAGDEPAGFEVVVDHQQLVLFDSDGVQIANPEPDDDAGRQRTSERLERWAKALALRDLQPGGLPPAVATVHWGRVVNGERIPLAGGETLHVGENIYVTVENRSDTDLYVAVFDIGVSGTVTLLTAATPTGRKLAPGDSYTLGERFGVLEGLGPISWPAEVPRSGVHRESILVILAEDWNDFQSFETARGATRGPRTPLESLLDSVREGTTREIPASRPSGGRYDVRRFDFDLSPTPRAPFIIDQSIPSRSLSWAASRSFPRGGAAQAARPPQRVAIRLGQVIIHGNRSLWGKAKVRIDSLALTGAADLSGAYRPLTEVFSGIGDGDRLPLDNMLIYEGPVARYLDFGLWVSRDERGAKSLVELLKEVAADPGFSDALTTLIGLTAAGPQATALVAAGAAATTVLYFAGRVLQEALGNSIGLYRRSFLPNERFGIGRYPEAGLLRAQDFSFSYEIVETS